MLMELGDRLVQVRAEQKLDVKEFSEMLNVTTQTYHNWASGKSYPEVRVIIKILELFPIYNALWLLIGVGEAHRREFDSSNEPEIAYVDGWKAKVEMLIEKMSEEIKVLRKNNDLLEREVRRLGQEVLGIRGILEGR